MHTTLSLWHTMQRATLTGSLVQWLYTLTFVCIPVTHTCSLIHNEKTIVLAGAPDCFLNGDDEGLLKVPLKGAVVVLEYPGPCSQPLSGLGKF